MGAFVRTTGERISRIADDKAFSSFNSKRVDFLIIDPDGYPRLVVEYHGSGHYQSNAIGRDSVKRRVLEKSGIPLVEISVSADKNEYISKIREVVNGRVLSGSWTY